MKRAVDINLGIGFYFIDMNVILYYHDIIPMEGCIYKVYDNYAERYFYYDNFDDKINKFIRFTRRYFLSSIFYNRLKNQ